MSETTTNKGLLAKLRLDSHHKIERFMAGSAIIFTLLGFSFVSAGYSAYESGKMDLSTTAIYSQTFTTSQSGVQGTVDGVWRNKDNSKVLVLMHINEKSNSFSTDANKYRAFVTGREKEKYVDPATPFTGQIITFGNNSYLGVLLDAAEPFQPQVLSMIMRNGSGLSTEKRLDFGDDEEAIYDESFTNHDQWRVTFNPSASEVQYLPALDKTTPELSTIYAETVIADLEKNIKRSLDIKLIELQASLKRIEEYENFIDTTRVNLGASGDLFLPRPPRPLEIADDTITGDIPTETDKEEVLEESRKKREEGDYRGSANAVEADEKALSGEAAKPYVMSTLELHTNHVAPNGYNFSWRDKVLADGDSYLDAAIPPGQNALVFMRDHARAEVPDIMFNKDAWVLSDGSHLFADYDQRDPLLAPLFDAVNNLTNEYSRYYSLKREYQASDLVELLNLNIALQNVDTNGGANTSDEAVTTY